MVRNGRLYKIMAVMIAGFMALAGRLFYIQVVNGTEMASDVTAQSLISIEGGNTRGLIYDRNGERLVASDKRFVYIIKKDNQDWKLDTLMNSINGIADSTQNSDYLIYTSTEFNKEIGETLYDEYNAYILQTAPRYSNKQLAAHLIGYLNTQDLSGASGIELMLDDTLSGAGNKLYAVADVKGNLLRGTSLTSATQDDNSGSTDITTTIDKGLQEQVENIIGEEDNNCAVVILDSSTGEILTMAQTPTYNPSDVSKLLGSTGSELVNKVTQGLYAPGSVFKIVVAAAALEQGISEDKIYNCSGSITTGNTTMGCETGGSTGHGSIEFKDAFAQSCNCFFVKLAQEIGGSEIAAMARKLGFEQKLLQEFDQERIGSIMTSGQWAGAGIANFAIGQGETTVTPLQVAYMTNIIARGGTSIELSVVKTSGKTDQTILSEATATTIADMMTEVVLSGTASTCNLTSQDGDAKAAVKTGTAEYNLVESTSTNGWITGFTPCDNPQYIITVLMEGGVGENSGENSGVFTENNSTQSSSRSSIKAGSKDAARVFAQIVEYIESSGGYNGSTRL